MLKQQTINRIISNIVSIGILCVYAILWTLMVIVVAHISVQIVVYLV